MIYTWSPRIDMWRAHGDYVSWEFCGKAVEIAKRLSSDKRPYDLPNLMNIATSGTFAPDYLGFRNTFGLIGFKPEDAMSRLGVTTRALKEMDAITQLYFVETYFNDVRGLDLLMTPSQLYMAAFYPEGIHWELDHYLPQEVVLSAWGPTEQAKTVGNLVDLIHSAAILPTPDVRL